MQTEIIWKTTLKNGIFGSLTPPLADPFNPDHFYVADGWGSMYASMRLHKLSFSTGKEVANVLIVLGRLKRSRLVQPWFQTAFAVGILYEMQHDKKCCGTGKEAV